MGVAVTRYPRLLFCCTADYCVLTGPPAQAGRARCWPVRRGRAGTAGCSRRLMARGRGRAGTVGCKFARMMRFTVRGVPGLAGTEGTGGLSGRGGTDGCCPTVRPLPRSATARWSVAACSASSAVNTLGGLASICMPEADLSASPLRRVPVPGGARGTHPYEAHPYEAVSPTHTSTPAASPPACIQWLRRTGGSCCAGALWYTPISAPQVRYVLWARHRRTICWGAGGRRPQGGMGVAERRTGRRVAGQAAGRGAGVCGLCGEETGG